MPSLKNVKIALLCEISENGMVMYQRDLCAIFEPTANLFQQKYFVFSKQMMPFSFK